MANPDRLNRSDRNFGMRRDDFGQLSPANNFAEFQFDQNPTIPLTTAQTPAPNSRFAARGHWEPNPAAADTAGGKKKTQGGIDTTAQQPRRERTPEYFRVGSRLIDRKLYGELLAIFNGRSSNTPLSRREIAILSMEGNMELYEELVADKENESIKARKPGNGKSRRKNTNYNGNR